MARLSRSSRLGVNPLGTDDDDVVDVVVVVVNVDVDFRDDDEPSLVADEIFSPPTRFSVSSLFVVVVVVVVFVLSFGDAAAAVESAISASL